MSQKFNKLCSHFIVSVLFILLAVLFCSLEFCSMNKIKRYSPQDAMGITLGDDGEFEGCDNSSDEDPEDPNYTPNNKDTGIDESGEGGDSDRSESSDLDEVPHPNMNPGQQTQLSKDKNKELCEEKNNFLGERNLVKPLSAHLKDHVQHLRTVSFGLWSISESS